MSGNYDFSANIGTEANSQDMKLSSPPFLSFVVATYFLANLIFLLIFLVNFPVVRDAISMGQMETMMMAVKDNYILATIAAGIVLFLDTIVIFSNSLKRRFPSTLSFCTVIYNDLMCAVFATIVYINDIRDTYFSLQITLLIPIITILLSSVFLIDDYHDLRTGKYTVPTVRRKKGELQIADIPAMTRTSSAEIAAANAAKLAIPTLTTNTEEPEIEEEPEPEHVIAAPLPTPEELAASGI